MRTFTHPAEVLTGLPIVVVAVAVLVARRGRKGQITAGNPARWLAPWAALALVLFAWEMYELFSSPRYDHPTLSSIGNRVLHSSRATHALLFALWLAAGAYLARPSRTCRAS